MRRRKSVERRKYNLRAGEAAGERLQLRLQLSGNRQTDIERACGE